MAVIRVSDVLAATSAQFDIPEEVIANIKMRSQQVTYARHICLYLTRKLTYLSLSEIAAQLNVDHSSVLYGFNRTALLMVREENVRNDVDAIKARLGK